MLFLSVPWYHSALVTGRVDVLGCSMAYGTVEDVPLDVADFLCRSSQSTVRRPRSLAFVHPISSGISGEIEHSRSSSTSR